MQRGCDESRGSIFARSAGTKNALCGNFSNIDILGYRRKMEAAALCVWLLERMLMLRRGVGDEGKHMREVEFVNRTDSGLEFPDNDKNPAYV